MKAITEIPQTTGIEYQAWPGSMPFQAPVILINNSGNREVQDGNLIKQKATSSRTEQQAGAKDR